MPCNKKPARITHATVASIKVSTSNVNRAKEDERLAILVHALLSGDTRLVST